MIPTLEPTASRRPLRLTVLGALLALLSLSPLAGVGPFAPVDGEARLEGKPVAFLAMGDWGTGDQTQKTVAQGLVAWHGTMGAAAVLLLGDNFLPRGVESKRDPQWTSKFEDMYPAEKIDIPFCPVLGNHDYQGVFQSEVDYSRSTVNGKPTRWSMPDLTWSRVFTSADGSVTVRVIALNTVELIEAPEHDVRVGRQMKWLDAELAKSAGAGEQWRVVVAHHPVYSSGKHGADVRLERLLKERFLGGKVDVYLAGHDHHLELFQPKSGVAHVVAGAGGKPRSAASGGDSFLFSGVSGFAALQFGAREVLVRFVEASGKALGAWKATKN
ncbi:MAG: metallophosphoesterase [Acidobacteria bacterium]|nr:metallophosphoesterase [Acidobacteriota bacterium]